MAFGDCCHMHVYAMATCTHWTAGAALGSDQHAVVPVTASGRSPWATPMLRPPITSFDERSPEGKQLSEQRVLVCTELLHCTPSATLMRGTGRLDQTAWHMHCKGWPATGCNSGSCACNGVHANCMDIHECTAALCQDRIMLWMRFFH